MPQPRKMKNVNIFVDVDLTLVDEMGRLLPGAAEALAALHQRGCHLFLWSSCGVDYSRDVSTDVGRLHREHFSGDHARRRGRSAAVIDRRSAVAGGGAMATIGRPMICINRSTACINRFSRRIGRLSDLIDRFFLRVS